MLDVSAFIIARNEEQHIGNTLKSLIFQTHPLREIVVINDGSTDRTGIISQFYVDVYNNIMLINLPYHKESYVGRFELATVCNAGLTCIKENSTPDYIIQMGADHVLSKEYIKSIIYRMVNNNVAIASGGTQLERLNPNTPWGSGRIIDAKIWREINDIQYPVNWGYESWIVYRMRQLGYQVKRYDDIHSFTRPIKMYPQKAYYWGKCSYALGCSLPFALNKAINMKSNGVHFLKGYFSKQNVNKHEDIEHYVKNYQYSHLMMIIKKKMRFRS